MFKIPQNKIRLIWLGGVAGVLLLVLLLWKVPQWSVPSTVTDDQVRAELLNANRENVLKVIQTLAGLGFIATAYLAYRNFQLTEDRNVSDRFTKAVEMLADERLEVRLGGVYALERIASDSIEDHQVVMEVLTAFIREKTRYKFPEARSYIHAFFPDGLSHKSLDSKVKKTPQDVQSALDVIGRRIPPQTDYVLIDLSEVDLSGALFCGLNFLQSNFVRADLRWVDFTGANLCKSFLLEANLSRAELRGANLSEAYLTGADFTQADLSGANLTETNLVGTCLGSITWNPETIWPHPSEVAKAKNIPEALKQQLGIEAPPEPEEKPDDQTSG